MDLIWSISFSSLVSLFWSDDEDEDEDEFVDIDDDLSSAVLSFSPSSSGDSCSTGDDVDDDLC